MATVPDHLDSVFILRKMASILCKGVCAVIFGNHPVGYAVENKLESKGVDCAMQVRGSCSSFDKNG